MKNQLATTSVVVAESFTRVQKRLVASRPIATYYYDSANSPVDQWCAIGRAATIAGGIRAAFRRILDSQAERALIHDQFGVVVARMHRTPKGIQLLYVPSTQEVH